MKASSQAGAATNRRLACIVDCGRDDMAARRAKAAYLEYARKSQSLVDMAKNLVVALLRCRRADRPPPKLD